MRYLLSLLVLADPAQTLLRSVLSRLGDLFTLLNSGILASVVFAILLAWWKGHQDKYDERKIARSAEQNPDTIHLFNLIGEKTKEGERIPRMLGAINRGAIEQAQSSAASAGAAQHRFESDRPGARSIESRGYHCADVQPSLYSARF